MKLPMFVGTGVSASTLLNGLRAYWKMDTNGSVPDATGNGHTGTIDGATFTASGKINGAYDYDGVNDGIFGATDTDINFDDTDSFTFACWGNFDTTGVSQTLMCKQSITANEFFINLRRHSTDKFLASIGKQAVGQDNIFGTTTVATGTWYLVGCTYNGTTLELFVNASSEGTVAKTISSAGASLGDVCMGISHIGTDDLDGRLDEPMIYDRVLTQDEWDELYASGSGNQYPF